MSSPTSLLFVYGSLKEGFPNHHVNRGRRVPGTFRTVHPHPFWLAEGALPCLIARPGDGLHVRGQLFEVGAAELAAMDALERVGESGGYLRLSIEVEPVDERGLGDSAAATGAPVTAFVYARDEAHLDPAGAHVGPLDEYTLEHSRSLRW